MACQRKYGTYPGFAGYAASSFKRLPRKRKLEIMTGWFHGHYEDPANQVSYNGREGGYLWVPGLGPNEANEEIQSEFGDVADPDLMKEAVEAVEAGGTVDWASKSFFREIAEEALNERDEETQEDGSPYTLPFTIAGRPSAGTAPTFSEDFDREPRRREDAARQEMLERLEHLERLIAPLAVQAGMMGHNGPPGPIEDPELPEQELTPDEPPLSPRDLGVMAGPAPLRVQHDRAANHPVLPRPPFKAKDPLPR